MSDKKAPAAAAPAAEQPAKKGGMNRLIIIAGVIVVLAGGGAAAYFKMRPAAEASEEHEADKTEKEEKAEKHEKPSAKKKKKKKKETESGLVSLEPFVVNLADPGGTRFLRVNVKLVIDSPATAEKIEKEERVLLVRIRASILEVLTQQTADQLVTSEGKEALKTAIAEHIEPLLEETEVEDVLFSDFVVQF